MSLRKILMADDDAEDKFILEDAIQSLHPEKLICFAEDGEEALHLLRTEFNEETLPCVILLDLNMPRLNGTQTLKLLKEDNRFSDIPVIIYSTSVNAIEKAHCLALGAHSYITKPLSFSESIETAKNLLRFCTSAAFADE
jgi:CheY-like chemotaxis protein